MARDLMRGRDQIARRIGESRSVKHLADVASCLGSFGVMVKESDAGYHVEQDDAAKNRKRLARALRREEPGW